MKRCSLPQDHTESICTNSDHGQKKLAKLALKQCVLTTSDMNKDK